MIELRNDLNLNVGLILTPNLDLSLKILAMNVLDIEEKAKTILEENPLIKFDEDISVNRYEEKKESKIKEINDAYKERFSSDERFDLLDVAVSSNDTIQKKLLKELKYEIDMNESEEEAASFLIHSINEKGFLDIEIAEIADRFEKDIDYIDELRHIIMNLEPLGCASLDTLEFMNLQAEIYCEGEYKEYMKKIITILYSSNKPNIKKLKTKLGIDDKIFKILISELSNFALYPLENYSFSDNFIYIEPDLYVKKIKDKFIAVLNEKNLSRIHIDEELFDKYSKNSEAKEFANEKYKEAKQFILSIAQRNKTLLRTMNIVIERQRLFFEKGILMPLSRKEIAKELGFNVSTITRAVSNKYIDFQGKLIPMKNFFSSGIDGKFSKNFIKNTIREIVETENKNKPFNDDEINAHLKKLGINITRRTVTKYRKEMNLPNSRERICRNI